MLANMFPDMLYSWQNGANPAGLERSRGETEFLALKFVQLILPWPGHRIDALATLRHQYDTAYLSLGEQPALGVIAAAGFLASFVVIALMLVGRRRFTANASTWQLLSGLSAIILFAFMCATIGGISTLVSFLTSSLRGWNRMSIVIMILSLGVIGLLLDLAVRKFLASSKTTRSAFVTLPLAAVMLFVIVVDQTPGNTADSYAGTKAAFESDEAWVQSLEDTLEPGSNVLLLPYIPYPESSAPNGALASDQMIPYLHSTTLHWSNGGIKGRPAADWPGTLENYPSGDLVELATAAGFAGIVVDRGSSSDHGAALETALSASLGTPPESSPNGRYGFFDISAELAATEPSSVGALITDPVMPYPTPDFAAVVGEDGDAQISSPKPLPHFTLTNSRDESRAVTLSFEVTSSVSDGSVTIAWPDGSTSTEPSTGYVAHFEKTLDVASGSHLVGVDSIDLDGHPVVDVTIESLVVTQDAVETYLKDRG
jgi:phosphoglycerol transferase